MMEKKRKIEKISLEKIDSRKMLQELIERQQITVDFFRGEVECLLGDAEMAEDKLSKLNEVLNEWVD